MNSYEDPRSPHYNYRLVNIDRSLEANRQQAQDFADRQAATAAWGRDVLRAQVGGAVVGALVGNAISGRAQGPAPYAGSASAEVDAACARAEARAAARQAGQRVDPRPAYSEVKIVLSYFGVAVATVLSALALSWVGAAPNLGALFLVLVIHLVARAALPSLYILVAYVLGFVWALSALSALLTSD